MHFFSKEQVKQFLVAVNDWEPENYPFFYLAIHTGMRMSEIIGLQWKDLTNNLLRVNRQVRYFKGQRFKFDAPKSKSGNRTIALGATALEVLESQKEIIANRKNEAGPDWDENDLVFPSLVGTPLMPSNVRRTFRRLIKYADLPRIRFHDLRHTAASLMLNNGIPLIIASKRLGHSKPSITLDVYGHLLPNKQEEAAELMDDLVA